MAQYLKKLENRMHHECFPADDELFQLVEQASAEMHKLAIHVHCAACEEGQAGAEAEVTAITP